MSEQACGLMRSVPHNVNSLERAITALVVLLDFSPTSGIQAFTPSTSGFSEIWKRNPQESDLSASQDREASRNCLAAVTSKTRKFLLETMSEQIIVEHQGTELAFMMMSAFRFTTSTDRSIAASWQTGRRSKPCSLESPLLRVEEKMKLGSIERILYS